jgi:hypothetical protein
LPVISGRPNLSGSILPEPHHHYDPIEAGLANVLICFNEIDFACSKLNIHNKKLQTDQKKAYEKRKTMLKQLTWEESRRADKQANGYNWIPAASIRANIPDKLKNVPAFICFKYYGKACSFGGFIIDGIHYIVWVGQQSNDLYNH